MLNEAVNKKTATIMGKRRRANVRRTAPLQANQAANTKTQCKAEKSKLSSQTEKIFATTMNSSSIEALTSGFPGKGGKRPNLPEKVSFKSSFSKKTRHVVVFKSPFKTGEQSKLVAPKLHSSARSPPTLSTHAGQLPKSIKATKTSDINTANIEQAESRKTKADYGFAVVCCASNKQDVKVLKKEISSSQNFLSDNIASSFLNVDDNYFDEAKTSSTFSNPRKPGASQKASFQNGTGHLQNADRPMLLEGCKLKERRNLLSLRNKCTRKENCNLTENQRDAGKQSTASIKSTSRVSKCPDREQFKVKSQDVSQSVSRTETHILQRVLLDSQNQDPEKTTASNSARRSLALNKNYSKVCTGKMAAVLQGSFPKKIRAGDPSVLSCARTLVYLRPSSLEWDIRDFELKTSFKYYRRSMKKN